MEGFLVDRDTMRFLAELRRWWLGWGGGSPQPQAQQGQILPQGPERWLRLRSVLHSLSTATGYYQLINPTVPPYRSDDTASGLITVRSIHWNFGVGTSNYGEVIKVVSYSATQCYAQTSGAAAHVGYATSTIPAGDTSSGTIRILGGIDVTAYRRTSASGGHSTTAPPDKAIPAYTPVLIVYNWYTARWVIYHVNDAYFFAP